MRGVSDLRCRSVPLPREFVVRCHSAPHHVVQAEHLASSHRPHVGCAIAVAPSAASACGVSTSVGAVLAVVVVVVVVGSVCSVVSSDAGKVDECPEHCSVRQTLPPRRLAERHAPSTGKQFEDDNNEEG